MKRKKVYLSVLVLVAAQYSIAQCVSTSTVSAMYAVNDAGIGNKSWNNPNSLSSSDGNMATLSDIAEGDTTNYLKATQFNLAIPEQASICGITVEIQKSAGGPVSDYVVQLMKSNVPVGANLAMAGTWTSTPTYYTYGGPSDKWGETWSAADVNAMSFGIAVSAKMSEPSNLPKANINHIRIYVYYNENPDSLNAKAIGENEIVQIDWTPSVQTINTHFGIYRSPNKVDWELVTMVTEYGEEDPHKITDNNPYPGVSYYQVRQTDVDGNYSVSAVIPVVCKEREKIKVSFSENTSITISSPSPLKHIEIFDLAGRILKTVPVSGNENINIDVTGLSGVVLINAFAESGATYSAKTILF